MFDVTCFPVFDGTSYVISSLLSVCQLACLCDCCRKLKEQLRHALELCAVGGQVVYYVCSMNPFEGEAVVADIINQAQGTIDAFFLYLIMSWVNVIVLN